MADLFVPPLARLPVAGELVATQDFLADSGGCAANTATAAYLARKGFSPLPERSAMTSSAILSSGIYNAKM